MTIQEDYRQIICRLMQWMRRGEGMNELRKVLELILKGDYHDLLMYLNMEEIRESGIRPSSEYFEVEGDFETDARHVYPNRERLIKTVIEKALKCPHTKTVALNEEGHAGIYCVDCGEQLEEEC